MHCGEFAGGSGGTPREKPSGVAADTKAKISIYQSENSSWNTR